jgi:hypothetical protein
MAWREELHIGNLLVDSQQISYGAAPGLYKAANGTNVLGTVGTSVTAVHRTIDNRTFQTSLVVGSRTVDTVTGAALGLGSLIYTFPAGDILINGATATMTATPSGATLDTDQPYMGIGTVVASGAVADLTGTATFDSIVEQDQVNAAFSGAVAKTALNTTYSATPILAAGAHTVYLNIADTWAAQDAALALAASSVIINWTLLS